MKIIKINQSNLSIAIEQAVKVLNAGGLVVYPTETCYGLGADATNQAAIDKLLSYKKRREGKPLSILVADQKMAEDYVELNESAKNFYENFLPGPVTVVSSGLHQVAKGVESEMGTLGIRMSSHPAASALAKAFGKPMTATSANASYKKKPYSIADLLLPLSERQKSKLDLILDYGNLPKHQTSTVIDTTIVGTMILRQGEVSLSPRQEEFTSNSPAETEKIAQTLMLKYYQSLRKEGLVLCLTGDLGTGKTVFAQGVGKFLKIKTIITSPSFTLVNEYLYERFGVYGIFYHLDPWRLGSFEDFLKLGLEKMLSPKNIILIEWASKFSQELDDYFKNKKIQTIKLSFVDLGKNERKISLY